MAFAPVGLFTRSDARAAGYTDRQVDLRLASGVWTVERRGILRVAAASGGHRRVPGDAARAPAGSDRARCPDDVLAALLTHGAAAVVVSHGSAARLWALPEPLAGRGDVTLTATTGSTRRRHGVTVRVAPLDDDVTTRFGVPVTSPARTVVDLLRSWPEPDAVAAADAALHRRLSRLDELQGAVDRQSGWPGIARARQLLAVLDGRRESPLESWSGWSFARHGVPAPTWQVTVSGVGGRTLGRVDAWWPEAVAGESDGRAKYALAAAARGGPSAANLFTVLDAERAREQRLRAAGVEVVRWGARDVLDPASARALASHLTRTLADARRHPRFRGDRHPQPRHAP